MKTTNRLAPTEQADRHRRFGFASGTSTNGKAHPPAALPAVETVAPAEPAPKPSEPVLTAGETKKEETTGRDNKGKFVVGNRAARGNANARRMSELRASLLSCIGEQQVKQLGEVMFAAALKGDWAAAKILLVYAIGRPVEAPNPDRLGLDEFDIVSKQPAFMDTLLATARYPAGPGGRDVKNLWRPAN
jgi:hypothetical protein